MTIDSDETLFFPLFLGTFKIIVYLCNAITDWTMEEKRYPPIEEECGIDKCCESAVGYAATGSGYVNTVDEPEYEDINISDDWDPGIGPYTMEELNARIEEAEVFIEKAERGDWSDWVTEEQSRANLYRKYPWLR